MKKVPDVQCVLHVIRENKMLLLLFLQLHLLRSKLPMMNWASKITWLKYCFLGVVRPTVYQVYDNRLI